MAYTMSEILEYKFPEAFAVYPPLIIMSDMGSGLVIVSWNVPGVPQPDLATIMAWATDPVFISNWNYAQRYNGLANAYKSVNQQLEMIYADLRDDTQTWLTHRGTVDYVNYPLTGIAGTAPVVTPIVVEKRMQNTAAYKQVVIASNTTAQAVSGTAKTTVNIATETLDAANQFASNTFTASTSGIYLINGFCQVANFAILSLLSAYNWQLFVTQAGSVNASTQLDLYTHGLLAALDGAVRGSTLIKLAAGDTVVLQVQKSLSTSLNVLNAQLSIIKVSEI